jgi:hypothetical protein
MSTMRAATFEKRYQPLPAPSGSDFWEREELLAAAPEDQHVWTVTEHGGLTFAQAGYHIVNKIGYVVTVQPWTTGDETARW